MNGFDLNNPTRIVFGPGKAGGIGTYVASYGKKALVVTSRGSIVKLGIYGKIIDSLNRSGVEGVDFIGVEPNPRLSTVLKGAAVCREKDIDVIVAVGGGSVIDCAKAIAVSVFEDGECLGLFHAETPAVEGPAPAYSADDIGHGLGNERQLRDHQRRTYTEICHQIGIFLP